MLTRLLKGCAARNSVLPHFGQDDGVALIAWIRLTGIRPQSAVKHGGGLVGHDGSVGRRIGLSSTGWVKAKAWARSTILNRGKPQPASASPDRRPAHPKVRRRDHVHDGSGAPASSPAYNVPSPKAGEDAGAPQVTLPPVRDGRSGAGRDRRPREPSWGGFNPGWKRRSARSTPRRTSHPRFAPVLSNPSVISRLSRSRQNHTRTPAHDVAATHDADRLSCPTAKYLC